MDGSHFGGGSSSQLSKDQLLPLQPLPLVQQQQLFSQSRAGSVLLLRTSRSPSATRSTEQSKFEFELHCNSILLLLLLLYYSIIYTPPALYTSFII